MAEPLFSWKKFHRNPIIGILRGFSTEEVLQVVPSYLKSGFVNLEITMNSPQVAETIAVLTRKFPELNIGAGTVCNLKDFNKAVAAGAQFIVTPIIDKEVIESSVGQKIPIFPGAFTPTEIYSAWSLGASAVKVFPATHLGPGFIKDILGPLKQIKLIPTGGVSRENVKSYFDSGAFGAGMGSSLFDKTLIKNGDYKGLENHFLQIKNELERFVED